ncbi:MAG: SDH family Clp fold serine proteinase [Methanosarcina sp.]
MRRDILVTFDNTTISFWDLISILFALFFLYAIIYPQSQLRRIRMKRLAKLGALEKTHGYKILTMIHRREGISFLGLPAYQFIDEEDAEQILRWIRKYKDSPLELILHTPGGQLHASIQIARALKNHPKNTRVIIPHYSMSGGTVIALAANEIIMDKDAVIGPIDPQIGNLLHGTYPAPSWIYAADMKKEKADDTTLIMSDISRKALNLTRQVARELLEGKIQTGPGEENRLDYVVEKLVSGEMIHSTPLSAREAKELGLFVSTDFPEDVHDFMKLFKPVKRSVEYIE